MFEPVFTYWSRHDTEGADGGKCDIARFGPKVNRHVPHHRGWGGTGVKMSWPAHRHLQLSSSESFMSSVITGGFTTTARIYYGYHRH